jgi:hypothetical protein
MDGRRRRDAGDPDEARRNVEDGQFGDMGAAVAGKSLTGQRGVGSSGRIRTHEQASTPAEPEQLALDLDDT